MAATRFYFDAWPGLDPKGAPLGELSQAYDRQFRVEDNGLGNGQFTINRHDSQAAWCAQGNLVRVRMEAGGPFDWDDPRYRFAFWLEEGGDTTISTDEEGGEEYARGGRGIMAYLENAIAWHLKYSTGTGKVVAADGYWEWAEGVHSGAVMNRLMNEVRARWTATGDTFFAIETFGDTHDSDGNVWDELDEPYRVNIGTDYLSVLGLLQDLSQQFGMDPDFALNGWTDHSEDLTASITFEKGVNIREGAERQIHASPVKSRVLVRGATKSDKIIYREVVSTATEALVGRREGFTEYTRTASSTILGRAGSQFLSKLRKHRDGPQAVGVTIGDGTEFADGHFVPWVDYREGSIVTLDIPGEYTSAHVQINAIIVSESDAGEAEVLLEFEETPYTPSGGTGPGGGGSGGGSSPGGCNDCPPHNEPPFEEICDYKQYTLHMVDGVGTDTFPARAGQYVYVMQIKNLITWAGTSPYGIQIDSVGGMAGGPGRIMDWASPWPLTATSVSTWNARTTKPPGAGIGGDLWDMHGGDDTGVWRSPFGAIAPPPRYGWFQAQDTDDYRIEETGGFLFIDYNAEVTVLVSDTAPGPEDFSSTCTEPKGGQVVGAEVVALVTNDGVTTTGQANYDYPPHGLRVGIRPSVTATSDFGAIQEVVPIETDPAHGMFALNFLLPDDWEVLLLPYQTATGTRTIAANTAPTPSTFALFPSDVVEEQREFGLDADVGLSFAYARGDATGGTPDDPGSGSALNWDLLTTGEPDPELIFSGGNVTWIEVIP